MLLRMAAIRGSFQYLTELERHAPELKQDPSEWMPWSCRNTLQRAGPVLDAA